MRLLCVRDAVFAQHSKLFILLYTYHVCAYCMYGGLAFTSGSIPFLCLIKVTEFSHSLRVYIWRRNIYYLLNPSNVFVEVTSFVIFYGNEVDVRLSRSFGCACTHLVVVPLVNRLINRMLNNHQRLSNYYYVDFLLVQTDKISVFKFIESSLLYEFFFCISS